MKRMVMALLIAVLGIGLFATSANAAGPGDNGRPGKLQRWTRERIVAISDVLNMTPREIAEELKAGSTIADLATEQGVAITDVENAIAQPRRDRLAEEVADGTLTQEQADYLNTQADERLDIFLNNPIRRAVRERLLGDFATAVGLSEDDVATQVQAGTSLNEIITTSGNTVDAVVDKMVALRDDQLTGRVNLDLLTNTQKNRLLRAYERILTNRLSQ